MTVQEVEEVVGKVDQEALKKGLIDLETGERKSLPSGVSFIFSEKIEVKKYFSKTGTSFSSGPGMTKEEALEKLKDFDHPEELTAWEDPFT